MLLQYYPDCCCSAQIIWQRYALQPGAKLPCAQLVKRAGLLPGKPPLNPGSHWSKIFFFFTETQLWIILYVFFCFVWKFPSKFSNMEFATDTKFLACWSEVWLVLLVFSVLFRIQTPVLHKQPRNNNTKNYGSEFKMEKILFSRF